MAKKISKARFDVFAIGSRMSTIQAISEEMSWWSDLDEQLIGTVFFEYPDQQYAWVILARDENGKFRCTGDIVASITSYKRAEAELRIRIEELARDKSFSGTVKQLDNQYSALDLLTPITDRDQLHPYFLELIERPGRLPARKIFEEIGPWLYPADKHFIREFQCHQFDQRLWELYLWASFREMGFDVAQREAPDFECINPVYKINFTVEATTTSPSQGGVLLEHPNPSTPQEHQEFLQNYMPMKFGSALSSKLQKVDEHQKPYWEREHSKGKPFLLALADFHKPADHTKHELGSMTYSQGALFIYLYGRRVDWWMDNGELKMVAAEVEQHEYQGKVIPSGFFDLPGAKNISGVLFSNAGTLAKFDRMGVCAGFEAPKHKYFRAGFRFNPDPNAAVGDYFFEEVGKDGYEETWCDELQLFHNPNAKHPIAPEWFPDIAHHNFIDGKFVTLDSHRRVLSSYTNIMRICDGDD